MPAIPLVTPFKINIVVGSNFKPQSVPELERRRPPYSGRLTVSAPRIWPWL